MVLPHVSLLHILKSFLGHFCRGKTYQALLTEGLTAIVEGQYRKTYGDDSRETSFHVTPQEMLLRLSLVYLYT